MGDGELDRWRAQLETPDEVELSGTDLPPAPCGHVSWTHGARERWPSLELPNT